MHFQTTLIISALLASDCLEKNVGQGQFHVFFHFSRPWGPLQTETILIIHTNITQECNINFCMDFVLSKMQKNSIDCGHTNKANPQIIPTYQTHKLQLMFH